MNELESIEKAKEHIKILLHFLKIKDDAHCQEEINECIETVKNEAKIYFHSSYINYKGIKAEFKILKRRARIQEKLSRTARKPRVRGFKNLISNLDSSEIESHRESSIYTEKGLYIIHTNKNYTILYGILKSPSTLDDLREKGFIKKPEEQVKTEIGWKIINKNGA